MDKFEALQEYLKNKKLVSIGKFDAWVESMEMQKVGKDTPSGHHLFNVQYQAMFTFEECQQAAMLIPALVQGWLSDHDGGRREEIEGKIKLNVTLVKSGVYHVDVQITFKEEVFIHESATGAIEYKGKKWTGGKAEQSVAKAIEVINQ